MCMHAMALHVSEVQEQGKNSTRKSQELTQLQLAGNTTSLFSVKVSMNQSPA